MTLCTQLPVRTQTSLSQDERETFARDGYVRLGRLVDEAALQALGQRIDAIMLGEIRYEGMMMQLDSQNGDYASLPEQTAGFKGPTLAYRKIQDLERDPLFLAYMRQALFRSLCADLVGPAISIYRSMFMNKPARQGTLLPWHQDGGENWNLSIDPIITLWLAIDPATKANGCVQVIPGSHRLGLLNRRGHTITPEQESLHCPEDRIEYLELQPGEVVLLHNFLLHRSDRNATDIPRRAFSACLMDAATRSNAEPTREFFRLF